MKEINPLMNQLIKLWCKKWATYDSQAKEIFTSSGHLTSWTPFYSNIYSSYSQTDELTVLLKTTRFDKLKHKTELNTLQLRKLSFGSKSMPFLKFLLQNYLKETYLESIILLSDLITTSWQNQNLMGAFLP